MTKRNHVRGHDASPMELVAVPVAGKVIRAAREGGDIWVSVPTTCDEIGVDLEGQRRKLAQAEWATTDLKSVVAEDGKIREVFCISHRSLGMWLASIHPSKVKPAARQPLIRLRQDAADAVADRFFGPRHPQPMNDVTPEAFAAAVGAVVVPILRDALAPIFVRLAAIEQHPAGGIVTGPVAKTISRSLTEIARILHGCGQAKSIRSARTRMENRLRGAIGWAGTGCSWTRLPASKHGDALRELDVLRRTAEDVRDALKASRQMVLRAVK